MMQDFKNLDVWREAKNLVLSIYKITETFPKHELFGLSNQMRRAAVSIPSNIAEGTGRRTNKDKAHFSYTSRGSLFELETQIVIAFELAYITSEDYDKVLQQVVKCRQLINGYINYFEKKDD
jgi:four helix bundle protein